MQFGCSRHSRSKRPHPCGGYDANQGTLASIQTKILLSDTFVRDYLLDPDENRSAQHNNELRHVWADLEQSLDTYAATPNATEAELAAQLRRQIEQLLGVD